MRFFIRVLFSLFAFFHKLNNYVYRKHIQQTFKAFGEGSYIESVLRLQGAKNISIGRHVGIHKEVWLGCLPLTSAACSSLEIADGCVIGDYNHIWSTRSIVIEKDVLTANNVYITDNLHGYDDAVVPIGKQPIKQLSKVCIGEGSWLGEHVCIIGASVGKHCVIGANSVVTHDVPDYSVAVGSPARVIKRYDAKTKLWVKV